MPKFEYIHKDELEIDSENVRPEAKTDMDLCRSIKRKGILQPLVVRPSDDKFLIIIGATRFESGKSAGLNEFPSVIAEELEDDDIAAMTASLHENLFRIDLSPGDKARIIADLCIKIGKAPSDAIGEISERMGMGERQVEKYLESAEMPEWYLELMRSPEDRNLPNWVKAVAKDPEHRTDSQKEALREVLPEDVKDEEVEKVLSKDSLKSTQLSNVNIAEELARSKDYAEIIEKDPVQALRTAIEASDASKENTGDIIQRGKKKLKGEEGEGSGRRSKKRGHKVEFKFRDEYYKMLEDYAKFKGSNSPNRVAKRIVGNFLDDEVRDHPRKTTVE